MNEILNLSTAFQLSPKGSVRVSSKTKSIFNKILLYVETTTKIIKMLTNLIHIQKFCK